MSSLSEILLKEYGNFCLNEIRKKLRFRVKNDTDIFSDIRGKDCNLIRMDFGNDLAHIEVGGTKFKVESRFVEIAE